MHPEDEKRGFKGLGKLSGTQPPPVPSAGPPPIPPPTPVPTPPPAATPTPTPSPGPTPTPAPTPPSPPATGGTKWTPPPNAGSSSGGCLKAGLWLIGMIVLLAILLLVVGRIFGDDDRSDGDDTTYEPAVDPAAAALEAARLEAEAARLSAEVARLQACQADIGTRPESGEVLKRTLGEGGHTLKINAADRDGLIKLRQDGATVLAFYVRAHDTAAVEDIPDGTYQVMFAGGSDFSRGCGEFITDMSVSMDPDPVEFALQHEGDASYFAIMEYTLTRHAGGNFEPQAVDPEQFRD